ncbi:MAG: glycosyl hydrolase 53 family protein [Ruminococcus sp.]|nr:glycosyl hydrolase 53 family protein [Ruminococcus sp.]
MMKKKAFRIALSLLLCLPLLFSAAVCASAKQITAGDITIESIDFQREDFIRGMDVSSLISLENAGVKYFDEKGRETDLLKLLAQNGVNYIRVRVWNDPYDEEGRGYGGGSCDVNTACEIGRRAAKYGMKLLVDFHYSDFWADPSKQKAPKAWENGSVKEKEDALYDFTFSSLKDIRDAGADIGMVQIGNETTSGIAGVSDFADMAKLFQAGSRAVRAFDRNILVAIHFTNPDRTDTMKWYADCLDEYSVDYDVFAASYYPFWHGSLTNLNEVLSYAAQEYGKLTMVAETSYPYTLADSDGHPNTVNQWNNSTGDDLLWDFTPQGQAEEIRAVMNAVNNVSDAKGLGVFYWEGAWISVGDTTGLPGDEYDAQVERNSALWEQYGCGWAASYAGEFDPDDAGKYYGGCAVDNQTFFDAGGKALPSLKAFMAVQGFTRSYYLGDADTDGTVSVLDATAIQKHLASLIRLSDEGALAADVEESGQEINILCATYIQKYLAVLETGCPVGALRFV